MDETAPGVCNYCGTAETNRTLSDHSGTRNAAPFQVTYYGPLSAQHYEFCDEVCLAKWLVDRQQATLKWWRDADTRRLMSSPKRRKRLWQR